MTIDRLTIARLFLVSILQSSIPSIPPFPRIDRPRRPAVIGESRRELDAPQQMPEEEWFRVTFPRVTERGVPGAAAAVEMTPGDGVIGPHFPARVGRLVDGREHVETGPRIRLEVVPLVRPAPARRKLPRRGMHAVGD